MAESKLKIAQILFLSAAVTAVLAVVFYLDLFGLGDVSWKVALLCAGNAVLDIIIAAVILSRPGR